MTGTGAETMIVDVQTATGDGIAIATNREATGILETVKPQPLTVEAPHKESETTGGMRTERTEKATKPILFRVLCPLSVAMSQVKP
jgi:hypothetical protein